MARIIPFRGIYYNPNKVQDLKDVTTPPYDVISEKQQQEYYERYPHNVIRLILGKTGREDTECDNRYTRAANFFHEWLKQGVLTQDRAPAFYLTEIDYVEDGAVRTRFGLIVLVELEDFEKGGILPHEKTFSATRADRLRLMEQCKANFSPVFSLFSDPGEKVFGTLRDSIERIEPDTRFKDLEGCGHRLWRLQDPQLHREIGEMLAATHLYIADGHHRYETALKYRNQVMSKQGTFGPDDPCNFVMMSLTSLNDPGLLIRPVHRLLCNVEQQAMNDFSNRASACFDVEQLRFDGLNRAEVEAAFLANVRAGDDRGVIGAVLKGHTAFYILRVKEDAMNRLFYGEIPAPLKHLDVTIATKLVLQQILGFDDAALDDERRILYASRAEEALEAVDTAKCDIALILNATRISQIEEVSKAGLTMPRKSSYFFPKVMTGLVMNKLGGG